MISSWSYESCVNAGHGLNREFHPHADRLGRRQGAQEIAEIVSERMKLEPHGVGCERPARQPRPLDRALSLFDPLLACAAFHRGQLKRDVA